MKMKVKKLTLTAMALILAPLANAQQITVDSFVARSYDGVHTYRVWDVQGVLGTDGIAVCVDSIVAPPDGTVFNVVPLSELDVLSFNDHQKTEGGAPITSAERDMAMWRAHYFIENYWADYGLSEDWTKQVIAREVLSEIFMDATNGLVGDISTETQPVPDNRHLIREWPLYPDHAPTMKSIIDDINASVTGSYVSTSYFIAGLDTPATWDQSLVYVSPIPEPTVALLSALSLLGLLRRRR